MASLPQTYEIVRQGVTESVVVADHDELIALRTELELLTRFGLGATPEVRQVLEARLEQVAAEAGDDGGRDVEDLQDMVGILRDAMNPATAAAIRRIDEDFPTARGEIDMASAEKESENFQNDVAKQAAAAQAKPAAKPAPASPPADPVEAALAEAMATAAEVNAAEPDPVEAALAEAVETASGLNAASIDPVEAALAEAVDIASELDSSAEDLAEAALAEAAATAAEVNGGTGEPVEATAAEAEGNVSAADAEGTATVDAAAVEALEAAAEEADVNAEIPEPAADPIEAIIAEQAAAPAEETAPRDPVEAILAEQSASDQTDADATQIVEELLAGQMDSKLEGEEVVDESVAEAWSEAVTSLPPSPPEPGTVEADLKSAGEPRTEPETASDAVTEALAATENEIDAIASAFEQATSDLGVIGTELAASFVTPDESATTPGESDGSSGFRFTTPQQRTEPEPSSFDPLAEFGESQPGSSASPSIGGDLRKELNRIKVSLQSELERVIRLLDRVDHAHQEAENRLSQARTFHEAARRAQEVSERLVDAQSQALEAKAAYELAQQRLDMARTEWEAARKTADDAAAAAGQ